MGRLTDLGSFIGAGGSGGIRGLTFLDSVSSGVPLEIIDSYDLTSTTTNLYGSVPDVEVGDLIILLISDDDSAPSYNTGFSERYSLSGSATATIYTKVIESAGTLSIDMNDGATGGHSQRRSGVALHVRGADTTTFSHNNYAPDTGTDFYFQALSASAGPRLVIAFGALDDDKIDTQSDQSAHGYTSYGAAISLATGSSTHVWAKITDGSAETQKIFSMNGGNDAYAAVIMGFSQAS